MFGFILSFVSNPMTYVVGGIAVLVLAAMYFTAPKLFLKVALDARTWLLILALAMASGYAHLHKQNEALKDKVEHGQQVQRAKDDTTATIRKHYERKKVRQTEKDRVEDAIANAKPGQAYDDALDEIARLQNAPVVAPDRQPIGVRHPDGVIRP